MGIALKKPAAEIWAMDKPPLGLGGEKEVTICLPRS